MHDDSTPADAIERGWLEYAEQVLRPDTDDDGLRSYRLSYYAGAGHAVGMLLSDEPSTWPATLDALATEVLDQTDRLLLEAVSPSRRAEPTPPAPPPSKQRTRRPSPARLAKWEAHWQVEGDSSEGVR